MLLPCWVDVVNWKVYDDVSVYLTLTLPQDIGEWVYRLPRLST